MGAAVKDVTSTQKVKAFWVNKDVIYKEKVYNEWFAPRVWLDQKTIVGPLLPKTNYLALSADMDEFFEPPEQKHIKGQNRIAYVQKRLWTPEPITLENVMTIPIYGIHARQNLLTATASKRGAFLNNFDNPNIRMPGLIHGTPPSGLYFFHFHFRGLEWFKNKFSKMSYATKGPGASTH